VYKFIYVEENGYWRIMNQDNKTVVMMRDTLFTDKQFRKMFIHLIELWNFKYKVFEYQPEEIPDIDPVEFFNRKSGNQKTYFKTSKCTLGGYQADIVNYPFIWCPNKKSVKAIERIFKELSMQCAKETFICPDDETYLLIYRYHIMASFKILASKNPIKNQNWGTK
jgi:hypothetical protein